MDLYFIEKPCQRLLLKKNAEIGLFQQDLLASLKLCQQNFEHMKSAKKTHDFKTMKVKIFWDLHKLIVVSATLGNLRVKCFNCELALENISSVNKIVI